MFLFIVEFKKTKLKCDCIDGSATRGLRLPFAFLSNARKQLEIK